MESRLQEGIGHIKGGAEGKEGRADKRKRRGISIMYRKRRKIAL